MAIDARQRATNLLKLRGKEFDLLVIGGGVVGAGIAWDAALRGLTVALVERADFASGTSSKSSKLLHGGLRYLEHGEVKLVFESLTQRNSLFENAAHIAKRIDFLFPIWKRGEDKGFIISCGLWLYDLLSHLSFPRGSWHQRLSPAAACATEPALKQDGLQAVFRYTDGVTEDARLVLETLKSAEAAGATVLNYAEVTGFFTEQAGGQVRGAYVKDHVDPDAPAFLVRAQRVFAAAGPWVDQVLGLDARFKDQPAPSRLRPTKGAHIVIGKQLLNQAVVIRSKDPGEKLSRVMFAYPWEGRTLIGTTDTDSPPGTASDTYLDDDCEVSADEVRYLLAAANASLGMELTEADVMASFAGWRPLIAPATQGLMASAVSRDHEVFASRGGIIAIAGGKLTGYRTMAKHAVDHVLTSLGHARGVPSRIEHAALSGCELGMQSLEAHVQAALASSPPDWDRAMVATLARRYGTNWLAIAALATEKPAWRNQLSGLDPEWPRWAVEVIYALRFEGAMNPADFLMRRTRLYLLDSGAGLGALKAVAELMAGELAAVDGWDDAAIQTWIAQKTADYQGQVAQAKTHRAVEIR